MKWENLSAAITNLVNIQKIKISTHEKQSEIPNFMHGLISLLHYFLSLFYVICAVKET